MAVVAYIGSHRDDSKSKKAECQKVRSICRGCGKISCEPAMHLHIRLENENAFGVCSEACAIKALAHYGITSIEVSA